MLEWGGVFFFFLAYIPWRALSSENSRATSSNLVPDRNLARASSFFECFSHYIIAKMLFSIQSQTRSGSGAKEKKVNKIYRDSEFADQDMSRIDGSCWFEF